MFVLSGASARAAHALTMVAVVLATLVSPAAAATPPPSRPASIHVDATSDTATITWAPSTGADHYTVCLRYAPTSTRCAVTSGKLTDTTVTLTDLRPSKDTDYYAYITAHNDSGATTSSRRGFNLAARVTPDVPVGVTQEVTTDTLTVSWQPAAHATAYSVCLRASEATETCRTSSPRSSALTATFEGLVPNAGGDFFYRVYAYNGSESSRSRQMRADLPVGELNGASTPLVRTTGALVTWRAATNAGTYTVQVAKDAEMTRSLATHAVTDGTTEYRVRGLTPGTRYYIRVRGDNGREHGEYGTVLVAPLPTSSLEVDVVTYNLCGQDHCRGSAAARKRIKPWSTRKPYAGKVVRRTGADLIATQESHDKDTRFLTQLPGFAVGSYGSAKTIFYRTSRFTKLDGGVIRLDSKRSRYAAWNTFRDKKTLTPFLFVDPHLEPYKGKTNDDRRAAQTRVLLAEIDKVNTRNLPVIYAGDFNSNKSNADQRRYPGGYDAPLKVFRAADVPDGIDVAKDLLHEAFNSANQALNPPLKHYDHVDHVFVTPNVRVNKWQVVLTRTGSRYSTPFATDHNPVQANLTIPGLPGSVG